MLFDLWALFSVIVFLDAYCLAGLDAGATADSVHAAFIPFGEIRGVSVGNAGGTRFALVHFEEIGDACSAVENMNRAEMFGHVLRVSRANPANLRTQLSGNGGPIWDSEAWLQEYGALES